MWCKMFTLSAPPKISPFLQSFSFIRQSGASRKSRTYLRRREVINKRAPLLLYLLWAARMTPTQNTHTPTHTQTPTRTHSHVLETGKDKNREGNWVHMCIDYNCPKKWECTRARVMIGTSSPPPAVSGLMFIHEDRQWNMTLSVVTVR